MRVSKHPFGQPGLSSSARRDGHPRMKTRTLGRTGLVVSEIGFGGVEIGMDYGIRVQQVSNQPSRTTAIQIVQRALDRGIDVIDTARGYGESERIVGEALGKRRSDVVLMTKVSCAKGPLSVTELQAAVKDSIDTSLTALNTHYVDVLSVHSATELMLQQGDYLDALDRLRDEGKARYLGATVYTKGEALAALQDPRIDVLQVAYSLLDPSMDEQVIPLARERGVGIVARSVLHRGVLTPKGSQGSDEEKRLHTHALGYDSLFDTKTRSLPHVALRFVLSNPAIGCALLGMDTLRQVDENLGYGPLDPYSPRQLQKVVSNCPANPWSILPGAHRSPPES